MNYLDDTLNIETPENVAFGYSIAGIGSRFLATLIDTIFVSIIQLLVMLPVLFFIGFQIAMENLTNWVLALFSLLGFVFFWGYYIFFELIWNGQSPGKRIVGLRVVRRDGTPVTLSEVLIRNLLRIIDLLPSAYGIGLISMFLDSQSRRLGDMAAGTLVVHAQKPLSLESLAPSVVEAPPGDPGSDKLPQGFPLERLSYQELLLIEDYLQRRSNLANSALLAEKILKKIYAQVGLSLEFIPGNAEETLGAIASAARRNQTR